VVAAQKRTFVYLLSDPWFFDYVSGRETELLDSFINPVGGWQLGLQK
jgi:hypothetical protein